jgi:hypothetical protein
VAPEVIFKVLRADEDECVAKDEVLAWIPDDEEDL